MARRSKANRMARRARQLQRRRGREWAQRVRELRRNLLLTQSEFGKKFGNVAKMTVSRWERGVTVPMLPLRRRLRREEVGPFPMPKPRKAAAR